MKHKPPLRKLDPRPTLSFLPRGSPAHACAGACRTVTHGARTDGGSRVVCFGGAERARLPACVFLRSMRLGEASSAYGDGTREG